MGRNAGGGGKAGQQAQAPAYGGAMGQPNQGKAGRPAPAPAYASMANQGRPGKGGQPMPQPGSPPPGAGGVPVSNGYTGPSSMALQTQARIAAMQPQVHPGFNPQQLAGQAPQGPAAGMAGNFSRMPSRGMGFKGR